MELQFLILIKVINGGGGITGNDLHFFLNKIVLIEVSFPADSNVVDKGVEQLISG